MAKETRWIHSGKTVTLYGLTGLQFGPYEPSWTNNWMSVRSDIELPYVELGVRVWVRNASSQIEITPGITGIVQVPRGTIRYSEFIGTIEQSGIILDSTKHLLIRIYIKWSDEANWTEVTFSMPLMSPLLYNSIKLFSVSLKFFYYVEYEHMPGLSQCWLFFGSAEAPTRAERIMIKYKMFKGIINPKTESVGVLKAK